MALITLEEGKKRLSYEYEDNDTEISSMISSIEGYLYIATGKNWENVPNTEHGQKAKAVAKEYVKLKLFLDYYSAHTTLDDARLTSMIKQLQYFARLV